MKEEAKDAEFVKSHSDYFDIDLADNIEDATGRLYRPKKRGLLGFFLNFFNCFSRNPEDDALPDIEHSFVEPLSPSYVEFKRK